MKRSKYIIAGVASILSLSLFSQGALADSKGTSRASVQFVEDTDVPDVLDPADPTDPYQPGNGDNPPTGNAGPLSLDYVSHLNFGQQKFSVYDRTYEAISLEPFIQVTDKRSNPEGWNVTVEASSFISNTGHKITGASIHFTNGETVSDLGGKYTAPTTAPFTLTTDDTSIKVVTAQPGAGRGSWIIRWFPKNPSQLDKNNSITLNVPGGTMKAETYTSTLTWTLTTAP